MKHNIIAVLSGTLLLANLSLAANSTEGILQGLSDVEKVAKDGRAALTRNEYNIYTYLDRSKEAWGKLNDSFYDFGEDGFGAESETICKRFIAVLEEQKSWSDEANKKRNDIFLRNYSDDLVYSIDAMYDLQFIFEDVSSDVGLDGCAAQKELEEQAGNFMAVIVTRPSKAH